MSLRKLTIYCLAAATVITAPAYAADNVAEAMKLGTSLAGDPVEVPKKMLGVLQLAGQAEIAFRIAEGARIPAEHIGWDVIVCDAQGDPARMASCGDSLLSQGADAVVTVAIEPSIIMAQLNRAKEAGVPWITLGGGTTPNELISAEYAPYETEMSDLLHEYLIKRLEERPGDKKEIAISTFSQIRAGAARSDDLYEDLKGTSISVVDEHVTNLANQIADARQSVTSQLTAFPNIDALLATASAVLPVSGQLVAQKFPDKDFPERPLVVGYLDELSNLEAVRKGEVDAIATMDLEVPGWVAVDQLAQYFARQKPLEKGAYLKSEDAYGVNLREATLVTLSNLPSEGSYVDAKFDHEAFFTAKWEAEFGIKR